MMSALYCDWVPGWGSINPAGDVWGPVLKQDYAELWTNQVLCHVVT